VSALPGAAEIKDRFMATATATKSYDEASIGIVDRRTLNELSSRFQKMIK